MDDSSLDRLSKQLYKIKISFGIDGSAFNSFRLNSECLSFLSKNKSMYSLIFFEFALKDNLSAFAILESSFLGLVTNLSKSTTNLILFLASINE